MLRQEAEAVLARKTGLDANSTVDQTRMRDAMREAINEISRRVKFEDIKYTARFTTVANQATYSLAINPLYIIDMRDLTEDAILDRYSIERFNEEFPDVPTTETGDPSIWIPLYRRRVNSQPTAASIVSIVSSSAADTGNVVIRGLSGGVDRVERLTLTGVVAVPSTLTYTDLYSITKDATTGTVTATSNAGAVTIITLLPAESEQSHWYIRLHRIPNAVNTMEFTYYRRSYRLEFDEDVIPFEDHFQEIFLQKTYAILLGIQGDSRADTEYLRSEKMLLEMQDNDYISEDEDVRFGFNDVSYEQWE